jgi:hypothetical protein
MASLCERTDHPAGVIDIARLPKHRAVALANGIGSQHPCGFGAARRATGNNALRLEVRKCWRDFPCIDGAKGQHSIIKVCWLDYGIETGITQHGDSSR